MKRIIILLILSIMLFVGSACDSSPDSSESVQQETDVQNEIIHINNDESIKDATLEDIIIPFYLPQTLTDGTGIHSSVSWHGDHATIRYDEDILVTIQYVQIDDTCTNDFPKFGEAELAEGKNEIIIKMRLSSRIGCEMISNGLSREELIKVADSFYIEHGPPSIGLGVTINAYQEYDGWVYYIDYPSSCLYRVNRNGENKTLIVDDPVYSFTIYESRIFYIGYQYYLHSTNIDGKDERALYGFLYSPNEESPIRAKKMQIVDGWIYILFEPTLYKIKTDGSELAFINFKEFLNDFCIDGDKIYYCKRPRNGQDPGLWQMGIDGTQPQPLMQESAVAIDYDENWIYYISTEDDDIYKISFDGSQKSKIVECNGTDIKVYGDWIYYVHHGEDKGIYKIKKDGSENTHITDYGIFHYGIINQWLLGYGDEISAIKLGESSDTEELTYDIISQWPNTTIYD